MKNNEDFTVEQFDFMFACETKAHALVSLALKDVPKTTEAYITTLGSVKSKVRSAMEKEGGLEGPKSEQYMTIWVLVDCYQRSLLP